MFKHCRSLRLNQMGNVNVLYFPGSRFVLMLSVCLLTLFVLVYQSDDSQSFLGLLLTDITLISQKPLQFIPY